MKASVRIGCGPSFWGDAAEGSRWLRLIDVACGRSGDKGMAACIGVLAWHPESLLELRD